MLVNMRDLLADARVGGYAVGSSRLRRCGCASRRWS